MDRSSAAGIRKSQSFFCLQSSARRIGHQDFRDGQICGHLVPRDGNAVRFLLLIVSSKALEDLLSQRQLACESLSLLIMSCRHIVVEPWCTPSMDGARGCARYILRYGLWVSN